MKTCQARMGPDGSKRTTRGKGTVSATSHPLRSGRWTSRAFGLTPLEPPGTVSKAGFQDFRIRVGTYSF
ncbi:MAG: hypothetical protein ABR985_10910 [Methanotrichaceae archaeon]